MLSLGTSPFLVSGKENAQWATFDLPLLRES